MEIALTPFRSFQGEHAGPTYLFTTGYIPEWETYPGPHIPVPVLIDTDQKANINRTTIDILGLSRMNWNTPRDTSGIPITLRFSREVGGIMAEVPKQHIPESIISVLHLKMMVTTRVRNRT